MNIRNPFRFTLVALIVIMMVVAVTSIFAPRADAQEYVPLNPADGVTAEDFPYPADGHVHSCKVPVQLSLADCSQKVDDMQWGFEFNHGLLFLARYQLQESEKTVASQGTTISNQSATITTLNSQKSQLQGQVSLLNNQKASLQAEVTELSKRPRLWAVANALPKCATEDSRNCKWIATQQGNGSGRSFIDLGGVVYYLPATSAKHNRIISCTHKGC